MASLPVKPLDGAGGYLRWKESLLLRVHTLGVAYVLSEARPAGAGGDNHDAAAAKKWARDDAVCRGHIVATLSDRLLPDYARFATAAELWRALARTYDVEKPSYWSKRFDEFCFDRSTGDVFLEQLAHTEALGAAAELSDGAVAFGLRRKLPVKMRLAVTGDGNKLESIWEVARTVISDGGDLWSDEYATRRRRRRLQSLQSFQTLRTTRVEGSVQCPNMLPGAGLDKGFPTLAVDVKSRQKMAFSVMLVKSQDQS